jgi:ABC-type microcin C transport system permease subunit YejE
MPPGSSAWRAPWPWDRGDGLRRGRETEGRGHLAADPREILPNALAPLVAEFGLRFCFVFLTISALSFLGLGIQPPTADWGSMVRDNATLISFGDITPLLPAGAIALLTVSGEFRRRLAVAPRLRTEGVRR